MYSFLNIPRVASTRATIKIFEILYTIAMHNCNSIAWITHTLKNHNQLHVSHTFRAQIHQMCYIVHLVQYLCILCTLRGCAHIAHGVLSAHSPSCAHCAVCAHFQYCAHCAVYNVLHIMHIVFNFVHTVCAVRQSITHVAQASISGCRASKSQTRRRETKVRLFFIFFTPLILFYNVECIEQCKTY